MVASLSLGFSGSESGICVDGEEDRLELAQKAPAATVSMTRTMTSASKFVN